MNGDGEYIYKKELNPENGESGLSAKNKRSASQILYETLVDKENIPPIPLVVYGMWEAIHATAPEGSIFYNDRVNHGFQKLFDMHTGDGTIMALGFLSSEIFCRCIDKVLRNNGGKGIDPLRRFIGSVVFGLGLSMSLEATTLLKNHVDIPGDFFGPLLGTFIVLATKSIVDMASNNAVEVSLDGITKLNEAGELASIISGVESCELSEPVIESIETNCDAIVGRK